MVLMLILLGQCLLCYNQSLQRSGHAKTTKKKKYIYIYVLACGLVSHARFAFFIEHNNIPEIFLVFLV